MINHINQSKVINDKKIDKYLEMGIHKIHSYYSMIDKKVSIIPW
jgi:hypothetical protein